MDAKQKLLAGAAILATSLAAVPEAFAQTDPAAYDRAAIQDTDTLGIRDLADTIIGSAGDDVPVIDGGGDTMSPIADTLGGSDTLSPVADTFGGSDPLNPIADTLGGGDAFDALMDDVADTITAVDDTLPGGADDDLIVDEYMGTLSGELLAEQNRLSAIQVPPPVEIPRTFVPTAPAGEAPGKPSFEFDRQTQAND